MNKIDELCIKLNQCLLDELAVQEYIKYEQLIHDHSKLQRAEKELMEMQKVIVNQKANNDECVDKTIALYKKKKEEFENHPLVVNYLYLKQEVDDLLQYVNDRINNQLK